MDDKPWEKCRTPILPRRTIDGGWTGHGQTWRRRAANGKWEYLQDAETKEDFEDRAI